MMNQRTIRLRRPPTITMHDTPFVPVAREGQGSHDEVMAEVDRRFDALCSDNPAVFDGRLCHVLGVHRNGHGGASIHVMDCAYRYAAVQDAQFDLGVCHLGVKGVVRHGDEVLMGLRASHVGAYGGMWEFAPSGMVEPGREPAAVVRSELIEETGLTMASEPTPIAVIFDPHARCWEVVYRLTVTDASLGPRTDEYTQLEWCAMHALPQPLSPPAEQIARLCFGGG
jgi:8-oxo-dGTP pyrophosphatase MutT (NUDIX family)